MSEARRCPAAWRASAETTLVSAIMSVTMPASTTTPFAASDTGLDMAPMVTTRTRRLVRSSSRRAVASQLQLGADDLPIRAPIEFPRERDASTQEACLAVPASFLIAYSWSANDHTRLGDMGTEEGSTDATFR